MNKASFSIAKGIKKQKQRKARYERALKPIPETMFKQISEIDSLDIDAIHKRQS